MTVDELRRLEDEWADVVRRGDVEAARAFLADDFVLTGVGGVAPEVTREAWFANLTKIETRSLTLSNVQARVYGDVAVVHLRLAWDATLEARDLTGDYAVTDVFTHVDGAWRPSWRLSVRLRT